MIELIEDNPGEFWEGSAALQSGANVRSETFDVPAAMLAALDHWGFTGERSEHLVTLPETGLTIMPLLVESPELREDGRVQIVSTVEIHHPDLFPHGTFEYQHAMGESLQAALVNGLKGWVDLDLPPILDALRPAPEKGTIWSSKHPDLPDFSVRRAARSDLARNSPPGNPLHFVTLQIAHPVSDSRRLHHGPSCFLLFR